MSSAEKWIPQAAAIPVKDGRVCVITSSSGKQWGVPKGIIDPGHNAQQTALQEAFEEAGLVGTLAPEPVGTYLQDKYGGTCHITVFLMHVAQVLDDWPERPNRQRCWLDPAQALERISHPDLREIVRAALTAGNPG